MEIYKFAADVKWWSGEVLKVCRQRVVLWDRSRLWEDFPSIFSPLQVELMLTISIKTKKENRMFDSTCVAFILPLRQLLGAWRGRQQGDLPQLVKQSSSWPQSASDVPARWQQSQTRYLNTNHCKVIQNKKRDRRIKRERTENRQDQYLEEREKEKKEMIVVLCWGISVWATERERESGKMTTMTTRHPPFFEWITPLWDSFFFSFSSSHSLFLLFVVKTTSCVCFFYRLWCCCYF